MPRPLRPLTPSASPRDFFGAELRRLRQEVGLNIRELAEKVHYSPATIAAIEKAQRWPQPDIARAVDAALNSDGVFTQLLPGVQSQQAAEQETRTADKLHEKASRLGDILSVAELTQRATSSRIGSGAVESAERTAERFAREYSSTEPGVLAPRVHRYLTATVRMLEGKLTLQQHRDLLVASGWLALLLAALRYDLKNRESAHESREAAFELGREADHNEIVAWSFETLAWFALADDDFRDALAQARAGQAVAPHGTSAYVATTLQEVRAAARLGDKAVMESALIRADAALERMPSPTHAEHHFTFDPPKLSFYAATGYVWLGDAKRAEEHARRVIKENGQPASPNYWPTRVATTFVELGLAIALRGDLDEAARAGTQAFDSPFIRRSTLWRAAELDRLLLTGGTKAPEVQEFHERYAAQLRDRQATQPPAWPSRSQTQSG